MNDTSSQDITNETLLTTLPGFTDSYADTNGIRLHYVEGGRGPVVVLLPGWPETWWAYHHMMPLLVNHYRVVVADLRGMGNSDKPMTGYDKKTMAADIVGLIDHLGAKRVAVVGHDIGAHVAYSLAANYPQRIEKLVLLDTPHPDPTMYQLPMLPMLSPDTPGYTYPWWVAFNQLSQLPQQLLAGRMNIFLDWVFDKLLLDKTLINKRDRAVYNAAYGSEEGIRASNAWYQAFSQDIEDSKAYVPLTLPVFGLAGGSHDILATALADRAENLKLAKIENSGHFLLAEQPDAVAQIIQEFLGVSSS